MILENKLITRFSKNFLWLFFLNNLGYVFSFFTLPVLISKYGLKETGVIFTIQSLVLALSAIANYSFVYYIPTVSRQISNDNIQFLKLWNLALSTRFLFSVLLSLTSAIIVYFYFNQYFLVWLLSLPILLPKIISPTLFCNALEQNQYVFKIGFFTKLFFLSLIFFTHNSSLVNLFFGMSEFVIILFFLKKIHVNILSIQLIDFKKIIQFLKQSFNLFLVNFFSLLRPASILPTISFFLGSEFATLYTLADKIMNVIRSFSGSMFVSFFPIYTKEKITLHFISFKNLVIIIVLSAISISIIWVISPYCIYYLNNFTESKIATQTLQILSLSIPMFFIIIPLFSYLLEHKKWNSILLFAIIQLFILFGLIFYYHQNIIQIAISFVISEYILLFCYYFYVLRLGNNEVKLS